MATFPPFAFQAMPEDQIKDVSANPTDDDGQPLVGATVAFAPLGPCTLLSPPISGDHIGDAAWTTVIPDLAAKNGDTVGVTATITEASGTVSTQDGTIALTTGGAVGAGFLESAPRPRDPIVTGRRK